MDELPVSCAAFDLLLIKGARVAQSYVVQNKVSAGGEGKVCEIWTKRIM